MRWPLRRPEPDVDAADFPRSVELYVRRLRRHYDFRAQWHRRFYRFFGILVIVAGAGLPVLVSLDYPGKKVVVSATGMLIAAITALRAFYRWDRSWIVLRKTETDLSQAWWDYQGRLQVATDEEDDRRQLAMELMWRVFEIRRRESELFFKDMAFPSQGAVGAGQAPPGP